MMRFATLPQGVVITAGAGRAREGAKRPPVAGVGESAIARHSGEHHLAGARGRCRLVPRARKKWPGSLGHPLLLLREQKPPDSCGARSRG